MKIINQYLSESSNNKIIYLTSDGHCEKDAAKYNPKSHCHILLGTDSTWKDPWIKGDLYLYEKAFKVPPTLCNFNSKANIDKSYNDLKHTDAVIVYGGYPDRLWKNIVKFNLKEYLRNIPIYIGISAGSHITLKNSFWLNDSAYNWIKKDTFNIPLLNFIDIKLEVHFNNILKDKLWSLGLKNALNKFKNEDIYLLEDKSYIKIVNKKMSFINTLYKVRDNRWYKNINGSFKEIQALL
jgi:hypothetical protein|tara:strand:- start:2321 stop:3034 length:714 start_codon:yes stop_codon:yes gene_type:complete